MTDAQQLKPGSPALPPDYPDQPVRARITYRNELLRSVFHNTLGEGIVAFGLLVAIRHFDAPSLGKSLLSASFAIGLLVTPIGLYLARQTGLRVSHIGSLLLIFASFGLISAASADTFVYYVCGVLGANLLIAQLPQLVVQMYTNNFTARERGKKLSHFIILGGGTAGIASWYFGGLLDLNIHYFSLIFLFLAGCSLISGLLLRNNPSLPLTQANSGNPWENVSLAWQDKIFGYMLAGWMILGIGNMLAMPLRYEYLANPLYSVNLTNAEIALILVLVPNVFRIFGALSFGLLFDRVNFIQIRIFLNLLIVGGIFIFFHTTSISLLMVGSALTGLAIGGSNIAWTLWVTKLAPENKIAAYMSVHTGFTGLRGMLAPFAGYMLLDLVGPQRAGEVGSLLVVISIFMFLGLWKSPRFR